MIPRLKQDYLKRIVPALTARFGYKNRHQVPRLLKVVVNTTTKDAVADVKVLDLIGEDIAASSPVSVPVGRRRSAPSRRTRFVKVYRWA